ncbi:hypothetical protein C0J52_15290 [Blattella germanica]|nr:hypothetical protein C0J52_15290 [Blattella germanica]
MGTERTLFQVRKPDKRARYLDTYVVKNTEVHYHNDEGDTRFSRKLASQNGGPIMSQYSIPGNEIPRNFLPNNMRNQPYNPANPAPVNFEDGNGSPSAVAQSCEGAICINLRSGFENKK